MQAGQSALLSSDPRICAPGGSGCPDSSCNAAAFNINASQVQLRRVSSFRVFTLIRTADALNLTLVCLE